jgi:hypothetical protein
VVAPGSIVRTGVLQQPSALNATLSIPGTRHISDRSHSIRSSTERNGVAESLRAAIRGSKTKSIWDVQRWGHAETGLRGMATSALIVILFQEA